MFLLAVLFFLFKAFLFQDLRPDVCQPFIELFNSVFSENAVSVQSEGLLFKFFAGHDIYGILVDEILTFFVVLIG